VSPEERQAAADHGVDPELWQAALELDLNPREVFTSDESGLER
jgi:hypothetical protein